MTTKEIILYGTAWCPGCRRAKNWLTDNNIEHTYVDVNSEEGRELFLQTGYQTIPVLEVDSELIIGFSADEYARKIL